MFVDIRWLRPGTEEGPLGKFEREETHAVFLHPCGLSADSLAGRRLANLLQGAIRIRARNSAVGKGSQAGHAGD